MNPVQSIPFPQQSVSADEFFRDVILYFIFNSFKHLLYNGTHCSLLKAFL